MHDEPVKIHLDGRDQVTQSAWDEFCRAAGLELADNGWFTGGSLRAGCDRATATFTGPEAVATAVSFWLRFGGLVSVSSTLDAAIDGALRERPCMTSPEKIQLTSFGWGHRLQAWVAWTREDAIPLRALPGCTVNLGTKDGVVYEGVTVTSFDGNRGWLTVEGGTFGHLYRDTDAIPVLGQMSVQVNDIARGYIHPAAVTA